MPKAPFANDQQKRRIIGAHAELAFWRRLIAEVTKAADEARKPLIRDLSTALESMGVPDLNRSILVKDGSEGGEAGILWEDEHEMVSKDGKSLVPRTPDVPFRMTKAPPAPPRKRRGKG